ncbi:unnamed protein product [Microthlaspi erraticum]|uniref:F-box domain-containing protein n=1 Tax=Microthlaspi erraticum TaxID=1685480 RepID=A0A6D2JKG0_9BRAS|nr:unnamed protein product [Microthlaspi erraticum]CAA7047126.1 unnamed protein product [Microthlaspi erraticum]CAA7053745.1 unnamed protein product [Microthlaspi erraticum]
MEDANEIKRLCRVAVQSVPDVDQSHVDLMVSTLLSLPDSLATERSFDRAFEDLLESSGDESTVDRGLQLAARLLESAKRCARRRATHHNTISWPLPHELTVKIFGLVDTKSLVQASASCTMFKRSSMDPFCYGDIDLTNVNVKSIVVRGMIFRAGKELRSLKVGCADEPTKSLLTRSCLDPLSYDHGLAGNLLESLHIYNHDGKLRKSICGALSVCSNLTDLKIVGLDIHTVSDIVDFLTIKCEHLFLQNENFVVWSHLTGSHFEKSCPNLTSLSLIGFHITDDEAYKLLMGLHKLKYIDLSRTSGFGGSFLRRVCDNIKDALIETIILRDCVGLRERMVCQFLHALLSGDLRFMQHIDVSNYHGLLCGERSNRKPKFPLEELEVERPGLTFVADFIPSPYSFLSSSDDSSSSHASSHSSTDSSA